MADFFVPYASTLTATAVLAGLFLAQILVADVAAIRAGHTPGTPVAGGHDDFLFRATRAHANTNENLPLFLLLMVSAVLGGASPSWVSGLTWGFVVSRAVHMAAYYADLRTLRSAAFGICLLFLIGLLVTVIGALWR
jgi:uncharacterized MAPEG superfamily protein